MALLKKSVWIRKQSIFYALWSCYLDETSAAQLSRGKNPAPDRAEAAYKWKKNLQCLKECLNSELAQTLNRRLSNPGTRGEKSAARSAHRTEAKKTHPAVLTYYYVIICQYSRNIHTLSPQIARTILRVLNSRLRPCVSHEKKVGYLPRSPIPGGTTVQGAKTAKLERHLKALL